MTAVVNVSATTSPVSGSVPVALSMTIAFLPSPLSWMSATSATTLSLPDGGSGREQPDPLGSVQQHGEVEAPDLGGRGERQARDDGVGGQHLLGGVVAVLGGERQILESGADAERIEQGVAVGPLEQLGFGLRAYGVGVDRA